MKRSGVHHALAVIEILLATSQSILARSGTQLNDFMAATKGTVKSSCAHGHKLMKDYRSTKWLVNRHAIDIVSQAINELRQVHGPQPALIGTYEWDCSCSPIHRSIRGNTWAGYSLAIFPST